MRQLAVSCISGAARFRHTSPWTMERVGTIWWISGGRPSPQPSPWEGEGAGGLRGDEAVLADGCQGKVSSVADRQMLHVHTHHTLLGCSMRQRGWLGMDRQIYAGSGDLVIARELGASP